MTWTGLPMCFAGRPTLQTPDMCLCLPGNYFYMFVLLQKQEFKETEEHLGSAHPILRYTGPPHPRICRPTPSPDTQVHPILRYTGSPHPWIHRSTPSSDTQVVSLFYISQTYLEYPEVKYIICPNHPHLHVLYKPKCSSI